MKPIYILIDAEDGEPLTYADSYDDIMKALDHWCGITAGQAKIVKNEEWKYDKEFIGTLKNIITIGFKMDGEDYTSVYHIFKIDKFNMLDNGISDQAKILNELLETPIELGYKGIKL